MQKNYPVELFHWAGMPDSFLYELKRVILESPEPINCTTSRNDNALIIASASNNLNMVQFLVEHTSINQQLVGEDGNAFIVALKNNNTEVALYLANHSTISLDEKDEQERSAYHVAAYYGNDTIIEYLLQQNININVVNKLNRHCIYDFVDGYTDHRNYLCFDYLESNINDETLRLKDKYGYNIKEYIESLIRNAENRIQRDMREQYYKPLLAVLEYRI